VTTHHPKGYIAGTAEWRYPGAGDEPCPAGTQCLILTKLGICVRGMWGDDAIAWAPFPKRDRNKEAKLIGGRRESHR
jgi:hypothetical protein